MSRTLFFVAAAVFFVPGVIEAQAPRYVQVTGVVGGSQLSVKAANVGGTYKGLGTLTAPNGATYNLKVTSGQVQLGRYVSLQGVLLAPNGSVASTFTLNGDANTGGIVFMYTGAGGVPIRQTTIGTVTFIP